MPEIPENIITSPVVPPSTKIVGCMIGAYDMFAQLENGQIVNIAKFLVDQVAIDQPGEVFGTFLIENSYGGTGLNSPASEGWISDAGNPLYYRALFLPALADMGVDPNKYKVEVRPRLVVIDALSTGDPVDIRLIDMVADAVVPGAEGSADMPGDATETVVDGDWVEVPTNACFFVDARKRNVSGVLVVSFRRQQLHVRIVRR